MNLTITDLRGMTGTIMGKQLMIFRFYASPSSFSGWPALITWTAATSLRTNTLGPSSWREWTCPWSVRPQLPPPFAFLRWKHFLLPSSGFLEYKNTIIGFEFNEYFSFVTNTLFLTKHEFRVKSTTRGASVVLLRVTSRRKNYLFRVSRVICCKRCSFGRQSARERILQHPCAQIYSG